MIKDKNSYNHLNPLRSFEIIYSLTSAEQSDTIYISVPEVKLKAMYLRK